MGVANLAGIEGEGTFCLDRWNWRGSAGDDVGATEDGADFCVMQV